MKKVYAYFNTSNKYNSIYQQTMLLIERLETIYHICIPILDKKGFYEHLNQDEDVILFPYDTLKFELFRCCRFKNIIFIYHNITPSRFFWTTEPLVAARSFIGHLQLRLLRYVSNHWIAVSEYNKLELESYGYHQVHLCSNLIKKTQSHVEKTQEPSLLYVGRIVQNKKCMELLDVAKTVSETIDRHISLYIVGSGKENTNYLRRFRARVKKYSAGNLSIHWLNSLSEEELSQIYQHCWLYITLSQHEGFGLPVCESINNGTPALYTSCGGQEFVLNNVGLTDEESMPQQVATLLNDQDVLAELYQQQKKIITGITIPNYDNEIKRVFDKLLLI